MLTGDYRQDVQYLNEQLAVGKSFDVVSREIEMAGKSAFIYFVDGFCKDDMMQKLLQYFMDMQQEDMPENAAQMIKKFIPYVEVSSERSWHKVIDDILSGMFVLLVEGFSEAVVIDARTYPARSVEEPDKDKALRGSKDGFVETIVFNTALIRRRIRDTNLRMEMFSVGKASKTDVVVCYMEKRVDEGLLSEVKRKLEGIQVDALNMNQESLAECLVKGRWFNPFPKFKYTERPDVAAAQVLEGNIVILVDNSPSAIILPATLFDIIEEADDFYFPPITGTYLKLTRFLVTILTYLVTPTFLLFMNNREWVPHFLAFTILKEEPNVPLLWQFLILEVAIDGLKLAAINTPNMLSTPLSVMAALVLGEFAVNSGWFSAEVMLYMAFVAIANYTQANYELGYALKFMRMLNLVLTQLFGLIGYLAGIAILVSCLLFNKTVSHKSYLYPLIPLDCKKLKESLIRTRLPGSENEEKS